MKYIGILFLLLICLIRSSIGLDVKSNTENDQNIELNALVYSLDTGSDTFNYYVKSFNEYSKKNNLNITVKLNLLSNSNSTFYMDNLRIMVEGLLKKKKSKYDIFFFDNSYTSTYGPYLLDMGKYLSQEHIDMYDKHILSQIGYYEDKLVGLPATIDFDGLFSNTIYLNKYDMEVPKTWDELIETSKYIMAKEKELNNTDLIAYNGLFGDVENGICSIVEFIYSCRESVDAPFPDLTSDTAVNALELVKKIKKEIASDEIFSSSVDYSAMKLFDGKALFVKFYYIPGLINEFSPYTISSVPRIKEGVSGTILVGYNMGVVGNIDEKKIGPAMEAIRYFSSRELQKELALKEFIISGITSLYEDEDVCSNVRFCDFYRYPQTIIKPKNVFDSEDYYEKYSNYFYDYLFGDEEASVVLKKMKDLTKIYKISLNTEDSSIGLIIFIIYICFLVLVLSSIIFLYLSKFKHEFYLLPNTFWYILIIGIILILSSGFTKMGTVTVVKCHLNTLLMSLGYTFIYVPILQKLIITFPRDNNKYSIWVKKNKYKFLCIFIVIDLILNSLTLIKPYNAYKVYVEEGENYQRCNKDTNVFVYMVFSVLICYKFIFALVMLLFTFIEWNILSIKIDIRLILTSIYLNIMTFFVLFIYSSFNINSYVFYYTIEEILILIIALCNFITLYILRLFIPILTKEDEDLKLFDHFSLTSTQSTEVDKSNITSNISGNQKSMVSGKSNQSNRTSILSKILDYHNKEYTDSESTLNKNNNNNNNSISITSGVSSVKYDVDITNAKRS